jgi:hypothetical protein
MPRVIGALTVMDEVDRVTYPLQAVVPTLKPAAYRLFWRLAAKRCHHIADGQLLTALLSFISPRIPGMHTSVSRRCVTRACYELSARPGTLAR